MNHLTWKLQFQYLFIDYDLHVYIGGIMLCPPVIITTNGVTSPNLTSSFWFCQDQLILNAIIGSLFVTIMLFIARLVTSREAWTILSDTYATPSRDCIEQVKNVL